MPTKTAEFRITVDTFRSIGSLMTCSVDLQPEPPFTLPDPVVRQVGTYSFAILGPSHGHPSDTTKHMQMKFCLKKDEYLLLGIAYSRKSFKGAGITSNCGQDDFTNIEIDSPANGPHANDRVMTITNQRQNLPAKYDYLFLIQRVTTGEIGVIDPEWENEN